LGDLAFEVAEHQPAALVEAEKARRAVEADPFEVAEQLDHERRPAERWLPDCVADTDRSHRHEPAKRDLLHDLTLRLDSRCGAGRRVLRPRSDAAPALERARARRVVSGSRADHPDAARQGGAVA